MAFWVSAVISMISNSRPIALAGFMGTGKTTVGMLLAQRMGRDFVDADDEIVRAAGMTIPQIFERHGEAHFRQLERDLLLSLTARHNLVIATGGGMVIDDANRALLCARCLCVNLTAPAAVILERVGGAAGAAARPMLRSGDIEARINQLLAQRAPAYGELHYTLDTLRLTPDQAAERIAAIALAEQQRIHVGVPESRTYDIVLGRGMLEQAGALLAGRRWSSPAAIVTDSTVAPLYADRLVRALAESGITAFVHIMPAGEAHKTLESVEAMYRAFSEHGVERNSVVIALGGGVVGDTAGFAAATYLRGVAFAQIPTTLLAMADSSIGGKVGVDTPFGKNLVGAFKQPELVIMETSCLDSLPVVELRCGLAEIIKGALLAGGPDMLVAHTLGDSGIGLAADDETGGRRVGAEMMRALVNKIELKRLIVEEDPFEQGRRALLNLGHTFGHGIEAWSGFRIKHGYAVALGMVCALRASRELGLCTQTLVEDSLALLRSVGLPVAMTDVARTGVPALDAGAIWRGMQSDKKKRAGRLRFVLIRAPGDAFVSDDVGESLALRVLRMLDA